MMEQQLQGIHSRIDQIATGSSQMVARIDQEKCVLCGACVGVCPMEAISMTDQAVVDEEKCTGCGLCVEECPSDAIELVG